MIKRRKKTDYINNAKLLEELSKYRDKLLEANKNNTELPRISNYIGESIIDLCNRLALRPNFIGYTSNWKDDMINDAILQCLAAVDNFDPTKSNNPFGYLTRVAWNAFIQRISKEKLIQYAAHKNAEVLFLSSDDYINGSLLDLESHNQIIENFENTKGAKNEKK